MSAHFRPPVIASLQKLWVALPIKAPAGEDDDPRERMAAIMDAYCFSLRSYSPEAIGNTIDALREGKIKEASKRFCPTSAELSGYVSDEQSRLDAINRPRLVSYRPASSEFKDWRIIQRQRTRDLEKQGYTLEAENVNGEMACLMARRKKWPAGNIWFWAIQESWSPPRKEEAA